MPIINPEEILIKPCTVDEIIDISQFVPEFKNPYTREEYDKRLLHTEFLAIKATYNHKDIGFKLGYALTDDTFYTWLGGVLPAYRQYGVAAKLADHQESWARSHHFKRIKLKTRNYFKPMLIFALKNGFNIVDVESKQDERENRIILVKELS